MLGRGKEMRIAALFLALFVMVVGVVGIVSPDSVTTVRRLYITTPVGLYAAGAVRVAMGLVVIRETRFSQLLPLSGVQGKREFRAFHFPLSIGMREGHLDLVGQPVVGKNDRRPV